MEIKKHLFPSLQSRRLFALLLVSLSVCLTVGEVGILSTLPFAVVVPFAVSFFYDGPLALSFIAALSAIVVSVASDKGVWWTVLFTAAVFVSVFLLSFAALSGKRYPQVNRTLRLCLILLILLSLCLCYALTFGNPVSCLLSQSDARDYLAARYPDAEISVERSHFDFSRRAYLHTLSFVSRGETYRGDLILSDEISDGYFDFVSGLDVDRCRNRIMQLLRTVSDSPMTPYSRLPDGTAPQDTLSPDGDNTFLDPAVEHYIAFDFETSKRADFERTCHTLVQALLSSDIPFASVTFYGGHGTRTDTFMYQLTVTKNSPADAAFTESKPFDKEFYTTLQKG